MKCDVCLTTIPIGENECPNCGYRIKKESLISSFDVDSFNHEHIKDTSKKIRNRLSNNNHKTVLNPKSKAEKKTTSEKVSIILSVLSSIIIPIILFFVPLSKEANFFDSIGEFFNDSINTEEYQEEIKSILSENGHDNIISNESFIAENETTRIQIFSKKNDINYKIITECEEESICKQTVILQAKDITYNQYIGKFWDNDDYELFNYLEMSSIFEQLNNIVTLDSQKKECVIDEDDYTIHIKQNKKDVTVTVTKDY